MSPDDAFAYGQMAARNFGSWHAPTWSDSFLCWAWDLGFRMEKHMQEYNRGR